MAKPLESLTEAELREMVVSLEAQLCDLYAQLDDDQRPATTAS